MMALPESAGEVWVYLSASPLFWLTAVLIAYLFADKVAARCNRHPLVNPVAIAATLIATVLLATRTPYQTFFDGAQFVHFLLGPATVALAVPLYHNLHHVRAALLPMGLALLAGSVTAMVSAVAIGGLLGLPPQVLAALGPKSVTTPVAMSLAKAYGGAPALAATFVVFTGICGGVIVTPLMNLLKLRNFAARGFAAGTAAHGIGTARAFQVNPLAGAFAGIALGLNAAMTSILMPLLLPWLLRVFGKG